MLNLRQEFPTQWHRFLKPTSPATENIFELAMAPNLFPFRDRRKTLKINTIWLLARCTPEGKYDVVITHPDGSVQMSLAPVNQYGDLHFSQKGDPKEPLGIEIVPTDPPTTWQLRMTPPAGGSIDDVKDVLLVLGYEWT
jgi:hypothetical protein